MKTVPPRARPPLAVCALTLALGAFASPAPAAPTAVQLRIEGLSSTIYQGPVTSDGHVVRPAGGSAQRCDGTNGGANPTPGPTPTSTLDDGTKAGRYTWFGDYGSFGFPDYFVSRIGPDSNNSSQFWGVFVNGVATQVGGCQQIVRSGQEVLWAFDAFTKKHVLRLAGATAGNTDRPLVVQVTDFATGAVIPNAVVGGTRTGPDGKASFRFTRPGIYRLKAARSDSVRSRELSVCIDPPGIVACRSTDRAGPKVAFALPRFASDRSRSRTFGLRWRGDDGARGSGITSYRVDARIAGEREWHTFIAKTQLTRTKFRGAPGKAYEFRVSAVDRAGNRDAGATDTAAVPVDDRDRKLLRFSRSGWKPLKRDGAWGGRVVRSTQRNAVLRVRLKGHRVALIGRTLPRGGRARVAVGGRKAVLRLRGKSRLRRVLWVSKPLKGGGRHRLKLRTLGGGPVEIDAVAALP